MPDFKRPVAMLFAVAALALGVTACGDDEDGESAGERAQTADTAQTGATTAKTAAEPSPTGTSGRDRKDADSGAARKAGSLSRPPADSGKDTGSSKKVNSDGSIENFGDAASDDDSSAAIAAAQAFYAARAADDWKDVCDLMSSGIKEQLEQTFAQNPKLKAKGCPAVVAGLVGSLPKPLRRQQAESTTFTEVRLEGDGAYVLFKSPTIPNGFLPMHREDGDWKVAAIAGSSL